MTKAHIYWLVDENTWDLEVIGFTISLVHIPIFPNLQNIKSVILGILIRCKFLLLSTEGANPASSASWDGRCPFGTVEATRGWRGMGLVVPTAPNRRQQTSVGNESERIGIGAGLACFFRQPLFYTTAFSPRANLESATTTNTCTQFARYHHKIIPKSCLETQPRGQSSAVARVAQT
jgi:hypothetical protein